MCIKNLYSLGHLNSHYNTPKQRKTTEVNHLYKNDLYISNQLNE